MKCFEINSNIYSVTNEKELTVNMKCFEILEKAILEIDGVN